jgi:hypothetical protein
MSQHCTLLQSTVVSVPASDGASHPTVFILCAVMRLKMAQEVPMLSCSGAAVSSVHPAYMASAMQCTIGNTTGITERCMCVAGLLKDIVAAARHGAVA